MKKEKRKIVIIGGGFGGLNTAKELRNTDVNITIIDKSNHHYSSLFSIRWLPQLYLPEILLLLSGLF